MGKRVDSLPSDKILHWSKLKAVADDKRNVTQKLKFLLGKNEKHFGERRKCWLPAFVLSSFSFFFSKGSSLKVIETQDCVAKSQPVIDD